MERRREEEVAMTYFPTWLVVLSRGIPVHQAQVDITKNLAFQKHKTM